MNAESIVEHSDTEHESLNLDEVRGWDELVEYVDELIQEFGDMYGMEDVATIEKLQLKKERLIKLKERCIELINSGSEVTAEDTEEAQLIYNEVANIVDTYEETPAGDSEEEVDDEDSENEVVREDEEVEVKAEEEAESESVKVSLEKLSNRISALRKQFSEVGSIENVYVTELQKIEDRAKALSEVITSGQKAPHAEKDIEEIDKNLAQLEQVVSKTQNGAEEIHEEDEEEESNLDIGEMSIASDSTETSTVAITFKEKEAPKKSNLDDLLPERKGAKNESLVSKRLSDNAYYSDLLEKHNVNWKQVDRNLKKTILEVERPDKLDVFLRVQHGSIFLEFLSDLTIVELSNIEHDDDKDIKEMLKEKEDAEGKQYQYRIYRRWLDQFDDMAAVVEVEKDMTFGELCTLFELVKLLPEEELA